MTSKDETDDDDTDDEGGNFAADFFREARIRNIGLDTDDLTDDDDDDDEEEEDDEHDEADDSSAISVSDDASSVAKEEEEVEGFRYKVPTTVPDPSLTSKEVVEVVVQALAHNDIPTPNKGIEILFAYSSKNSQIAQTEDLSEEEYAAYLKEGEYRILFDGDIGGCVVERGDYSPDGSKSFVTARIPTSFKETTPVNFILSTDVETSCWMIDSMLIRPPTMRRNRRR